VEFALSLPILVIAFFGLVSFWGQSQREVVYIKQSQALAEIVARSGAYVATTKTAIQAQLDAAIGSGSSSSYLYIEVTKPDTTTITIGTPVPASVVGSPPSAPSDTGWNSTSTIANLPAGSVLRVDIWGYSKLSIPLTPIGYWLIPDGHSVIYSLHG
jgi:Flp pilus assembly protein TadG